MELYHFDGNTGRYIKASIGRVDPKEPGRTVFPQFSTKKKPSSDILAGLKNGYWNGKTWTSVEPAKDPKTNPYAGIGGKESKILAARQKYSEITAKYNTSDGVLLVGGYRFKADAGLILGLNSVIDQLPYGYTREWETVDLEDDGFTPIFATVNKNQIRKLGVALIERIDTVTVGIRAAKQSIMALIADENTTYQDILDCEV